MYVLEKTCIFPVLSACFWHKMARTGFGLPLLEWPCSSLFSRKIAKLRVAQAQQKLFILTRPRGQYGQDNKLILEERLQWTVSNCVVVLKLASMAQSTTFPPVSIPFHVHPSKLAKSLTHAIPMGTVIAPRSNTHSYGPCAMFNLKISPWKRNILSKRSILLSYTLIPSYSLYT